MNNLYQVNIVRDRKKKMDLKKFTCVGGINEMIAQNVNFSMVILQEGANLNRGKKY